MLGILLVDFWVVNKKGCDIEGLYNEASGKYSYKNGFGASAFISLAISALLAFWQLDMAWIVGAPCAAILYYLTKCVFKLDEKF